MRILDVSTYQPTIDYAVVAKNIDGVILRIGFTGWGRQSMEIDSRFEKHYAGFKAAGVPVGAYYYSAADTTKSAQKEAEFCLSLLEGKQFELPIYYDVESRERQEKLSKDALTELAEVFCNKLETAGYYVGYYSYTAWLLNKFDTARLSKYTLWKADYRASPDLTIKCDMLQYTGSGTISGIIGKVDLSRTNKDFAATIINAGLNGFSKPITPEAPSDSGLKELAALRAKVAQLESELKAKDKLLLEFKSLANSI